MKVKEKIMLVLLMLSIMIMCNGTVLADQQIANGCYFIRSGNSASRVLDIDAFSMSNGGNLQINSRKNTTNQMFYIKNRGNGYYSIQAMHSGLYLHNSGANLNVHQWKDWNHNDALWKIVSAGNGYYYFVNKATGKYMDNSEGKTSLYNNVRLYKQTKLLSQKWFLVKTSIPSYTMNVKMNDVPNGTITNAASIPVKGNVSVSYPVTSVQLGIYDQSGKCITRKTFVPANRVNFSFSYSLNLSSLSSGEYFFGLKATDTYNRTIQSGKYTFRINKKVEKKYARPSNGVYYIASALNTNYVMDVKGSGKRNGTNVQLYNNKKGKNQKFSITHISDGWYKIIDTNSNKSIDAVDGTTKYGLDVKINTWNGIDSQQWRFYDAGGGSYYITNRLGYLLDISDNKVVNCANIYAGDPIQSNSQRWQLLNENNETERLEKMIYDIDIMPSEELLNKNEMKMINAYLTACNKAKSAVQAGIGYYIHHMVATNLPKNVEEKFLGILFSIIDNDLSVNSTSYDNVKSAFDLVKKISNETPSGTNFIVFNCNGKEYGVNINYQAAPGGTVCFLNFRCSDGSNYIGLATSIDDYNISSELSNLKIFAESKIEEANSAIIKDFASVLIPSDFRIFIKNTTKSKAYSLLNEFSPELAKQLKAADTMAKKFIDLKDAYLGLRSIDISKSNAEKMMKTILNYNKKIEAFNDAVSKFVDL